MRRTLLQDKAARDAVRLIADYDAMVAHSEETGQGDPPEQSEAIAAKAIELLRKLTA